MNCFRADSTQLINDLANTADGDFDEADQRPKRAADAKELRRSTRPVCLLGGIGIGFGCSLEGSLGQQLNLRRQ